MDAAHDHDVDHAAPAQFGGVLGVRGCRPHRRDLDVSKPLWSDACVTLGRDLAAVALAIVSTKDPDHFRTTPGGYFHGMVQKAKAGELHLERTVWALRRAGEPKTRREAGQGRGP
ncbi:MAG: replication initiation protein RepC [Stellaceae bacterium]